MRLDRFYYDTYPLLWHLRPPCPECGRRTWPRQGILYEEIYWCFAHGAWIADVPEDDEGRPLPLFRWAKYEWRAQ